MVARNTKTSLIPQCVAHETLIPIDYRIKILAIQDKQSPLKVKTVILDSLLASLLHRGGLCF